MKIKSKKCLFARSIGEVWGITGTAQKGLVSILSKGKREATKGDRVFNVRLARDVSEVFGISVPIGSREYYINFDYFGC